MITISVTYRAIFEGPTGELNPLGVKIPGPCPVELFKSGKLWKLREIQTRGHAVYVRLQPLSSPNSAMDHIARCFTRCIEPWQVWGIPPIEQETGKPEPRLLLAHEFSDLGDGKIGWYTPDDFTHITRPHDNFHSNQGAIAACGAHVSNKKIVSTKANKEPSCPACAAIYREEYAEP